MKEIKKKAAQAIVNIFETGTPYGDYGKVTLLSGDTGHLTYGRSQTTLASGNLYLLVRSYCQRPDAELGEELSGFLTRLDECDLSLDNNRRLKRLLRDAGDDPVMQETQDAFFDRVYWNPACHAAGKTGIKCELGLSVVYDSFIHGSWGLVKRLTDETAGLLSDIGESSWIAGYVAVRREWLAGHENARLHATVYRMDSFRKIIATGNWGLELPFVVRGVMIDKAMLMFTPSARAESGPMPRMLKLRAPYMEGEDVKELQKELQDRGYDLKPDGIFGPVTRDVLEKFQKQAGLVPDGICGAATRSEMEMS